MRWLLGQLWLINFELCISASVLFIWASSVKGVEGLVIRTSSVTVSPFLICKWIVADPGLQRTAPNTVGPHQLRANALSVRLNILRVIHTLAVLLHGQGHLWQVPLKMGQYATLKAKTDAAITSSLRLRRDTAAI
jgi:hypothetical protein